MNPTRLGPVLIPLSMLIAWTVSSPVRADDSDKDLAAKARSVLEKHCYSCHGQKKKIEKKLKILDQDQLVQDKRHLVVPKAPDKSDIIKRIEDDDDPMPPEGKERVPKADRKLLRDWIAAGAPKWASNAADTTAAVDGGPDLPPDEASGKGTRQTAQRSVPKDTDKGPPPADVPPNETDRQPPANAKPVVVKPAEPADLPADENAAEQPRVKPQRAKPGKVEVADTPDNPPRDDAPPPGAKPIVVSPDVAGNEYVHKHILGYVRNLRVDDKAFIRFFSLNHLLAEGISPPELEMHRVAFVKALNHLTWESNLVRPQPIDEAKTVFVVDLRELGWTKEPLEHIRDRNTSSKCRINLYDLALLEYPYGTVYQDTPTYDRLLQEYLLSAGQIRPVAYVRADWFVSVALQPPLYYEFLQMPRSMDQLEQVLGVDSQRDIESYRARRAGLVQSKVSPHNRVVERHPSKYGAYWKSYDYLSSKGRDNIFRDPVDLHPDGNAVIFTLPNGLNAYFLASAGGRRMNEALPQLLADRHAEDYTVRAGLSCLRCHAAGVKPFKDSLREAVRQGGNNPAIPKNRVLELYPEEAELNTLAREDAGRYLATMEKLFGKAPKEDALLPVAKRYLDAPIPLPVVGAELGAPALKEVGDGLRAGSLVRLGIGPLATGGIVRRDAWEDSYDQVVQGLGLGLPVVPYDSLGRRDHVPDETPFKVKTQHTGKGGGQYQYAEGDDHLVLCVTNTSGKPLCIEVIRTGPNGDKSILVPGPTWLKGHQEFQCALKAWGGPSREQITVFACDVEFPGGELFRGKTGVDRVVHPFYELHRTTKGVGFAFDPSRVVKRTFGAR